MIPYAHERRNKPGFHFDPQRPANANVVGMVANWHHKPKDTMSRASYLRREMLKIPAKDLDQARAAITWQAENLGVFTTRQLQDAYATATPEHAAHLFSYGLVLAEHRGDIVQISKPLAADHPNFIPGFNRYHASRRTRTQLKKAWNDRTGYHPTITVTPQSMSQREQGRAHAPIESTKLGQNGQGHR